jgi:hypothetical protein
MPRRARSPPDCVGPTGERRTKPAVPVAHRLVCDHYTTLEGWNAAYEAGSQWGHLYLVGGNFDECFVSGRIEARSLARADAWEGALVVGERSSAQAEALSFSE